MLTRLNVCEPNQREGEGRGWEAVKKCQKAVQRQTLHRCQAWNRAP